MTPRMLPALLLVATPLAGCGPTCLQRPEIDGDLRIAEQAGSAYDRARWTASHARDVDEADDGELSSLKITFGQGGGFACKLDLWASRAEGEEDFVVTAITLEADSACEDFPDEREGTYALKPEEPPILVAGLPAEVPDENAGQSCFDVEATFSGLATLESWRGEADLITLDFEGLTLRGALRSRGEP